MCPVSLFGLQMCSITGLLQGLELNLEFYGKRIGPVSKLVSASLHGSASQAPLSSFLCAVSRDLEGFMYLCKPKSEVEHLKHTCHTSVLRWGWRWVDFVGEGDGGVFLLPSSESAQGEFSFLFRLLMDA